MIINPGNDKRCQQPENKTNCQSNACAREKITDSNAQIKCPRNRRGNSDIKDNNCRAIIEKTFPFE
jgi:hypothetical protein